MLPLFWRREAIFFSPELQKCFGLHPFWPKTRADYGDGERVGWCQVYKIHLQYLKKADQMTVSRCFEPSHPLGVTPGLNTNSNLSLSYSAHESFNISHNISTAQLFQICTHSGDNISTAPLFHTYTHPGDKTDSLGYISV